MNITQFLKPILATFKMCLVLFITIQILSVGLFFILPSFGAGSILGFPFPFYVFSCGFAPYGCDRGFQVLSVLWDILFWYGIAILIKIVSKKLFFGLIIVGLILSVGSVLITLSFRRDSSPSH